MKTFILRFTGAIIAVIVGLVIIIYSLSAAPIIRDNIVSCLPKDLSEMFDEEQSKLCSDIDSHKNMLIAGVLGGGALALMGFILILINIYHLLGLRKKDTRWFRSPRA